MLNIPVPIEPVVGETRRAENSWYNYWMEVGAGVRSNTAASLNQWAALANSNLIVNGCHDISQENGNTGVTSAAGAFIYTTDQWVIGGVTSANVFALRTQAAGAVPPGFNNALQLYANVADAAVAANDAYSVYQPVEGTRWGVLGYGTANALPVAVGFWVYAVAGATGTYSFSITNSAADRTYVHPFTINAGDTWEYKSFVIPGDVTGTWAKDTSIGAYITVCVMAGANYQAGADTWGAGNKLAVAGQVNLLGTIAKSFLLTGVTLLPLPLGTTVSPLTAALSPLLMRDPVQELALCQRYWNRWGTGTPNFPLIYGYAGASVTDALAISFPVQMRVSPAAAKAGTWGASNCGQPSFGADPNGTYMSVVVTALGGFASQPAANCSVTFNARM